MYDELNDMDNGDACEGDNKLVGINNNSDNELNEYSND